MRSKSKLILLAFVAAIMVSPLFISSGIMSGSFVTSPNLDTVNGEPQLIELDTGEVIEVAPDEELHKFSLSDQGDSQWTTLSSPLIGSEYGSSTNLIENLQMQYLTGSTTQATAEIPMGVDWEAYHTDVDVTSLTENRTWVQNHGFQDNSSSWTITPTNTSTKSVAFGSWVEDGHGLGDDCVELGMNSTHTHWPYKYNLDQKAWVRQTFSFDRGDIVWAGYNFDYWAETLDGVYYNMTGSFQLYLDINGTSVWRKVFETIPAERTWYNTGLNSFDPSLISAPSLEALTAELGLWSVADEEYNPDVKPRARFDNIELYLKTKVYPSEVNFKMNGFDFSDDSSRGLCAISETPLSPWTTNPVPLNFSWTPIPSTPSPNLEINVDFDITVTLYTRRHNVLSHYEINPSVYGEKFIIWNGTQANFTSYFRADIPVGYSEFYYFNESIPSTRDVYFVAKPLAPISNLTTGWNGGDYGDGFVNVSTYEITSEPGRYGYWRILSNAPNMITDLRVWDPIGTSWERDVTLRAGDTTQIRVYLGAGFTDSLVNITLYRPDGSENFTVTAVADASGYATTSPFSLPGSTAPAGNWMVQAVTNDIGATGSWFSAGFFKRSFGMTHNSNLTLTYPTDAVGTLQTNVTFGDLLLIIVEAEDIDSSVLVPGGTLSLDWILGTDTFDDGGNGEYTKILDTSSLPGKGPYVIDLTWFHSHYESSATNLTILVNYATTLTSPDYPGISGGIGYNQSFSVDYRNVNGTGITTATVYCNWSNPYTMTPEGLGTYSFELDTAGVPIGLYPVEITAYGPYVNLETMLFYVEVREVYNNIQYSANRLSIPLGEAESFIFTWTESDAGRPIEFSADSITCNWTDFHGTGDTNYTVVEIDPGVYNITIYTTPSDQLTEADDLINVVFNVQKQYYQNHTFSIDVEIRKKGTLFILDEPISQTQYGDTISILVYYQDTESRSGISNATGDVQIVVTSSGVTTLLYSCSDSLLGTGHFNISIDSMQWGSIGWKDLKIFVEWTGTVDKYYNQTIENSVRIIGTDTDLYLEQAPSATYYQDSFNFSIIYWNSIAESRISNTSGNVILRITALEGGHSVTQQDFSFYESGTLPGTYVFSVDSSLFPSTDTFRFEFVFMWKKGQVPLYENRTMIVSLLVLDRPTYINYEPSGSAAYGEWSNISFSYIDILTSMKIQNSTQLLVALNDPGVAYELYYNDATRMFTISIDTATLPGIGSHTIHLNLTWIGTPFYASVGNQELVVTVVQRVTQLTHLSVAPSQWGNNVTIELIFTDLVTGSSSGMTGTLTLNVSSLKYTVIALGDGHFLVILNTTAFPSNGLYALNATIVHTNPNYASATDIFDISILNRLTQFGYDSPDPAPYESNLTIVVTYTDDSTGQGIAGADISVTGNSTFALVKDSNYWVQYLGNGIYLIEIDSIALGAPSVYLLTVSAIYSGEPFYLPSERNIVSRVAERTAQILVTKTPGETPFLENITIHFKFEDFLLGTKIVIDKSDITLTHGPSQTVIPSGDYTLVEYSTYYEISFNSTILDALSLVSVHEIEIFIDTSSESPYYGPRGITTYATTVSRPTQILFPLVVDTPYYDNITIEFNYIDFLTGQGIDGADVSISCLNWTVPDYTVYGLGDGLYRIHVNSSIFGSVGTVYFDFTLSKTGIPFYASRSTYDVPASIRLVQTSLVSEAPPIGSTPVGIPIEVFLTLSDFDHDLLLENAMMQTNWTDLYGTGFLFEEIEDGLYKLTLDTTDLLSQKYVFQVWSSLAFYEDALTTITVQPGATTVEIYLAQSTYYPEWGESVNVTFQVIEPFYGTPISGMNATLLWNGILYDCVELGEGYYGLILDTSTEDFGIYQPVITVTREYYQTRQKTFTLIVSKATGQILPEHSIYNVVIDNTVSIVVYLNDAVLDTPVTGATVTMEWNGTVYTLTPYLAPGYYNGTVNATDYVVGQYPLTIRALTTNHRFLEVVIDINVIPVPTTVSLQDESTLLTVYFGDHVSILVVYNDTFHPAIIENANISYVLGSLSGQLTPELNGTYSALIDISGLASQSIYLRIVAEKDGYATAIKSIIVTILPIPTEAYATPILQSGYWGDTLTYNFFFNDTQHNELVTGANIIGSWEGGIPLVESYPNGTYVVSVLITVETPGLFDLSLRFDLTNYTSRTVTVRIEIYATPAEIIGPNQYSIPVNDSASILYTLRNQLDDSNITEVIGMAYSDQLGEFELELLANGSYSLNLFGDLPFGTYTFDIAFSSNKYTIAPLHLDVTVRRILTTLTSHNLSITTSPGLVFSIDLFFFDADHNIGISGANISVDYNQANITYLVDQTYEVDGEYRLFFSANIGRTIYITITFQKDDYETKVVIFEINSDISAEQQFSQVVTLGGGFSLIIVALLVAGYVRVWSVPIQIRNLNRMIRALGKKRVPKAPKAPIRQEMVMDIVNEDLETLKLSKSYEDISEYPIVTTIPEVDELLEELASITGLGEAEIQAFRADLARMKASERPGFITEVIVQERARRADALAKPSVTELAAEEVLLEQTPEALDDLRKKLLKKGMAGEEIEVILEEAKSLSKADLDALLASLGIEL